MREPQTNNEAREVKLIRTLREKADDAAAKSTHYHERLVQECRDGSPTERQIRAMREEYQFHSGRHCGLLSAINLVYALRDLEDNSDD